MDVLAVASLVDDDVRVQTVLFDELVGKGVAQQQLVRSQVEDEDLGRTDLLRFGGDVDLAGVEDPEPVAGVRLDAEH